MNEPQYDKENRIRVRADVYRLLSACYYEPEAAFLEEDLFGQLEKALGVISPHLSEMAVSLGVGFRDTDPATLLLDYTRLFIGPFEIRAKPYGSVYLDAEDTVMGESTMQALALYEAGGLKVAESFREVPDHVALELEFLYLLTHRLRNAGESGDDLRALKKAFLRDHLGAWIGPFSEAMEKGADTDFYRQLASLSRHVVLDDLREQLTGG